jgi:hypothetical protein
MHLTPCYISFPIRYSIAPANKNSWEDRTHPWGGTAASFRVFSSSTIWCCFECPYSQQQQHSIGGFVFFFLSREAILLSRQAFLSREPYLAKNDSTIPTRCKSTPADLSLRLHVAFLLFLRCTYAFRY